MYWVLDHVWALRESVLNKGYLRFSRSIEVVERQLVRGTFRLLLAAAMVGLVQTEWNYEA